MTGWLADTSALVRIVHSPDAARWLERVERGLVHVGSLTLLELGFTARSGEDHRASMTGPLVGLLPRLSLTPRMEDRALAVQEALAFVGRHRGVSVAELTLAAMAELSGLTVLHVDRDFDLIASVTGQPVERLIVDR